ncbi:MAG: DUF2007 domain-containing protein [Planctomycetes bacterium]|nr:DUF2007 domain-containing protein [Planctomycetota bacterium]
MWSCPRCRETVEDEFEVCWSCGSDREGEVSPDFVPEREGIISEQTYQAVQAAAPQTDLMTVGLFPNASEAHMARSLLEAEGIHGVVMDELSNVIWQAPLDAVPLQVAARDADRARAILAQVHHTPPPEPESE